MAESEVTGEIDFSEFVAPVVEPVVEPVAEVAADTETETEAEASGGRANDRIRGLIEENKELQRRMDAMDAVKDEVIRMRQEMAAPEPEPEAAPAPEFMEDPKGYIDANQQKIADQLAALQEQAKKGDEQSQMQLAEYNFRQTVGADEARFAAEKPDYLDALNHVRAIRSAELADLGMPENNIPAMIDREEMQAAAVAIQNKKSPSEYMYNRAGRLGYKAAASGEGDASKDLDEAEQRLAAAQNAASMGGSGTPEGAIEEDAEEAAWDPIKQAFKEAWGEDLQ